MEQSPTSGRPVP